MIRTEKLEDGKTLYKVKWIADGSFYAREGIKVGDLVFAQGERSKKIGEIPFGAYYEEIDLD